MSNYKERCKCYLCGISMSKKAAIEVDKVYPSQRIEKVLVCYMCYRDVRNAVRLLRKVGYGRYVTYVVPKMS